MKNALRIADLGYKIPKQEAVIYPAVLDVRFYLNRTVYVFKLHHGINPKEVERKEYVFRSIFGGNLEFSFDTSTVSMTVYNTVLNDSYNFLYEEWNQIMSRHKLPIIAGKDQHGKLFAYNMIENPHLLIAGETGSGKSVCLRSIITSLILHKRRGLRIHLCDLKRTEFFIFRNVDIVDAVITDKKDVGNCIAWFHDQLTKRGKLLDSYEVEHIDKYNEIAGIKPLDYLLLCIDEFSILRDQKETMEQIKDLTTLGRALGIFLILSTQRPDRTVIEGILKANLTVRYAFRHADKVNSRITLGDGVSVSASDIHEDEKGKFIMRYTGMNTLQAPFLDVEEAKNLLETYKTQKVERRSKGNSEDIIDMEPEGFIPLFEEELK